MRAFAFGLLLAAGCSGSLAAPDEALTPLAGSGGVATSLSARADGGGGAVAIAAAGGGAGGSANIAGASNAGGAGGHGVAGAPTSMGGAVGSGGAAGSLSTGGGGSPAAGAGGSGGGVDPLAPFPAPGCADYTEYRIPPGKSLTVTGDFTVASAQLNACIVASGQSDIGCAVVADPGECPKANSLYCDGDYSLAALKAWTNPSDCNGGTCSFTATLEDGNWACVKGVPVAQ